MRLDGGNRSFVVLLAAAGGLYLVLAAAVCALLSLLLFRLATEGSGPFEDNPWALVAGVAFLAVNAAGAALGVRSLGGQLAATRQLERRVRRLRRQCSPELAGAARAAGLRRQVRLIDAPGTFAFTYGVFRPRVAISQGLLERVLPEELEAVLVHERYHVRNLDPLKLVFARALTRSFFLLPAVGELEARYLAARELAADRRVVRRCGNRPLAGALLKAVRSPAWPELTTAAAIDGRELLDVRVRQLESGTAPALDRLPRRALVASSAALALLMLMFVLSIASLGGLTAALDLSDHELHAQGLAPAMAVGCALPWLVAGWLTWRWYRG
jgi:Zn-dependent protease with chaperone function